MADKLPEVLARLADPSPSIRSGAVNQIMALIRPGGPEHLIEALHKQLAQETVPIIAASIRRAIASATEDHSAGVGGALDSGGAARESQAEALLHELSGMIRHELSPAIGAIRYTAALAIDDFESSEVSAAIEALLRRLDGLVSLARAQALPRSEKASLGVLLEKSVPSDAPRSLLTLEATEDADDDSIETDVGLFTLLMANVFQNAIDAAAALSEQDAR